MTTDEKLDLALTSLNKLENAVLGSAKDGSDGLIAKIQRLERSESALVSRVKRLETIIGGVSAVFMASVGTILGLIWKSL